MNVLLQKISRSALAALAIVAFFAGAAHAQMTPQMPPPQIPTPNPSSTLVLPQAPEVPVSPSLPRGLPGPPIGGTYVAPHALRRDPHRTRHYYGYGHAHHAVHQKHQPKTTGRPY